MNENSNRLLAGIPGGAGIGTVVGVVVGNFAVGAAFGAALGVVRGSASDCGQRRSDREPGNDRVLIAYG